MKTILVTGGAGFIGSHTVVEAINAGWTPIIYDNFSNSSIKVISKLEEITGQKIDVITADVQDKNELVKAFKKYNFDSIIHFAGLKAVGESVQKPLLYYNVNLTSTITLIKTALEFGCKNFIFSSSATVYNNENQIEKFENTSDTGRSTNPYGTTKIMQEWILDDVVKSGANFKALALRYFNPIGAHPSGLIGEDPSNIPNNLAPYIADVAIGNLEHLNVFGNDYDTKDGTGVRDYVHVKDLAIGHIKALEYIFKNNSNNFIDYINLGTGIGTTVLELVDAYEKAAGHKIKYKITDRRPGDVAANFANVKKAKDLLGFVAKKNIFDMANDSWNWKVKNPNGFK